LAVLACAVFAAGCGDDDSAGEGGFELRIGNVLPFTGDLAPFGPSLDRSARLAVQEIDAALRKAGVEGVSVEIVDSQDDETRPQAGVEAAKKLVETDDVQVLVGSMASQVTLAIAESVTIPSGVVMITPTSTAPEITDLDDDDLVWRVLASDTLQGSALADAVTDAFGDGATVNVGARNDAFGDALKQLFVREYEANGGQIGANLSWNPEAPNFDSEAQDLTSGNPDGWVVIDFPETYQRFGPALARAGGGWSPDKMLMTEAMRNEESLKEVGPQAAEGLRGTAPTSEGAPAREELDRLFESKASEDEPLTGFEGSSFDSVILAFLAAVKAGSSDPEDIKENLQAVSGPPGQKYTYLQLDQAIEDLRAGEEIDYEGAWGPIDWTDVGDPSSAIYEVWRYGDGKIDQLKTFTFGER
jgi:branched-chain amino acid transport system substrate-binding protein